MPGPTAPNQSHPQLPRHDPSHPLALALRGGRMGWWSRDLTTSAVVWSPELEELFGLPPGGFPGHEAAFYDLIHPDDVAAITREIGAAITERRDYIIEFRFRHANGTWRWMEGRGLATYLNDQAQMVYGVGIDITDRRRAQDTIRENAQQLARLYNDAAAHARDLERANRDLSDFAHIAAHDLKEPFRTINFQISFVLEDYKDTLPIDAITRMEAVQRVALRGTRLLDELMRFARSGEVRFADRPVELGAVAHEAAAALGGALADPAVQLTIEPGLPAIVCDPGAMSQVFANLIANAVKFNRSEHKRIRIFARQHTSAIQVCVEDNGIGIAEPRRADVFRIFKRLHREEDFGPGSGVGLAIVKKIIESHRGEVTIEETKGGGTTFVLTLPSS